MSIKPFYIEYLMSYISKHLNPSNGSNLSNSEGFIFPPSVQVDLFNYLKEEQKDFVRPILRVLKKPAQEELCTSLLDYLETGEVIPPADFTLGALFFYITRAGGGFPDDSADKRILRPLHYRSHVPMKIGEVIDKFFPMFKK